MQNILTFDVEDWYHVNYEKVDRLKTRSSESRVQEPTRKILQILRDSNNTATFFVLGSIAQSFPKLVIEIMNEGHEIASHGYNHELVYNHSQKDFIEDIKKSKEIIEDLIGESIIGYRAPSWSVSMTATPWVWKSLKKTGFLYDSSIFPFRTFLYGSGKSNPYFHVIFLENGEKIFEVPPSVIQFCRKRIPFSGGFYFRFWPLKIIELSVKHLNRKKHPAVLYLHPREIDINQPKLNLKLRDYFIQYYNIKSTEKKLVSLLSSYKFTSIKNMYQSYLF